MNPDEPFVYNLPFGRAALGLSTPIMESLVAFVRYTLLNKVPAGSEIAEKVRI